MKEQKHECFADLGGISKVEKFCLENIHKEFNSEKERVQSQ